MLASDEKLLLQQKQRNSPKGFSRKRSREQSRGAGGSGGGTLLGLSAITSRLRDLGYSQRSLTSMQKCGEPDGRFFEHKCGCGTFIDKMRWKCNLSICNECAIRRKRRIFDDFLPVLGKLRPNHNYFYRILTINPENYDNLKEAYDHIRKSYSKLIRREFFKSIVGGLYAVEVTNNGNGWNVHIHAVIYSKYLDNEVPLIGGDSPLVVECNKTFKRRCNVDIRLMNSHYGALAYVLDYISFDKTKLQNEEQIAQYIFHSRKRKMIQTFGKFYARKNKNSEFMVEKPTACVCSKCGFEISLTLVRDYEVIEYLRSCKPPPIEYW